MFMVYWRISLCEWEKAQIINICGTSYTLNLVNPRLKYGKDFSVLESISLRVGSKM